MSAGAAFALAGVLLAARGLQGLALRRRAREQALQGLGEPWFTDYPWDPEELRTSPGASAGGDFEACFPLPVYAREEARSRSEATPATAPTT